MTIVHNDICTCGDCRCRRLEAEIDRLRSLCLAHDVDPEGCVECFQADVERRQPAPLPHGITPLATEQSDEPVVRQDAIETNRTKGGSDA